MSFSLVNWLKSLIYQYMSVHNILYEIVISHYTYNCCFANWFPTDFSITNSLMHDNFALMQFVIFCLNF